MPADTATEQLLRRLFDATFAAVVLVLTAPIMLIAAIAIRLETKGSALFKQVRVGQGGRLFTLYKLRGMYVDAPDRWPELYGYHDARPDAAFHIREDPRVTRVGRLIRRISVDELPNFFNVLRGDMSVVGPRPEIPELTHLYGDRLALFLSVKPGVTSPPKSRGRDALTFEQTLQAELEYIMTRSVAVDLRTIARTAVGVLRADNAH